MKIRNGFVSNSSTSSFIITGESIFYIAQHMINVYFDDSRDFFDSKSEFKEYKKNLLNNFQKAKKSKKIQNDKIGITFPSCNQDTYLLSKNDKIYILTCNNHPWEINGRDIFESNEGNEVDKVINEGMFYDLKNDVIRSGDKYEEKNVNTTCKKCKHIIYSYYIMKNKAVCSNCLAKIDINVKPIKPVIVDNALQYIEL
jgi:hypothetical protein